MATLQLENVPEDLLQRLKLAAEARHHDFDAEVVGRLNDSFGALRVAESRTPAELIALAKQIRGEDDSKWLTPEFIRLAREYGRE